MAIKLAANRRVVCGTPAYFERHGKPKMLDDLARHNCLAFNQQGGQQTGWFVPARLRLFVDYFKGTYARPGYWSQSA